ncbi:MAG: hypothetical protein HOH36_05160 [Acidimicrobiaceae bacterium]|nr:hypothetical protein [Acidimicrobiaceae bacterium]MBT5579013.1 hypothetical protein [Acidimicrobiaceae bacterium]MBT5849811.1 hypothetical protein [Acidimicrobiaceae bacterium]
MAARVFRTGGTLLVDIGLSYAVEEFRVLWPPGRREHLPEATHPPSARPRRRDGKCEAHRLNRGVYVRNEMLRAAGFAARR